MAIDDKNIGGEGYTIISNKKTKKVAAMIMSTKHCIIEEVLHKIPRNIRWNVQSLSRDLAESYNWVGRTCFPRAVQIADKFHIVKLGLEVLQSVRVRYRQIVLTAVSEGNIDRKIRYSKGDTIRQLLAKSRYLLFSFDTQWTDSQKERAEILFSLFPEIKKAYRDICSFRSFYNISIGNTKKAKQSLFHWYERMNDSQVPELKTFLHTVKNNQSSSNPSLAPKKKVKIIEKNTEKARKKAMIREIKKSKKDWFLLCKKV